MQKMQKRIYLASPHMGGLEQQFVNEAFATNWIAPLGPNVNEFEKEVAYYVGVRAAALSSGTSAIHLALKALGIKRKDRVFCTSLTFAASCNPIRYERGEPVFIDSEPESWNMSPVALGNEVNEVVRLNAEVTGAEEGSVEYRYVAYTPEREWIELRGWETESTHEWTPELSGNYTVEVQVKDGTGTIKTSVKRHAIINVVSE